MSRKSVFAAIAVTLSAVVLVGIGIISTERTPAPHRAAAVPSASPEATIPPWHTVSPNGTRVAFYGDSYTLGTGASSPANRWSTIICEERGWSEFNPSVDGLGFINNRYHFGPGDEPSKVIADKPDIVFVTMGLNDNFSYRVLAKQIHKQIGLDFTSLKAALPDARFIVVEPFWYSDQRPKSLRVISDWVKTAAAAIHADYIPGASHWIEHHPEWMAKDGLHPNDAGYAHMAAKMDAALRQRGL